MGQTISWKLKSYHCFSSFVWSVRFIQVCHPSPRPCSPPYLKQMHGLSKNIHKSGSPPSQSSLLLSTQFFLPHQLTKHVLYTIELRTSVEIETVWVKGTTHSEIVNYNHFYTTFHHRLQYLLSEYLQGGWECPVAGRLSGDIGHSIRHIASDFSCSRRDQALNVFCVTRLPID